MVNYVDEFYYDDYEYEDLSLDEACNQLRVDTSEIVNNMEMSILLSEHAYLYENGCDVEYVDDYGYLTEEGEIILESFGNTVKKVWEKIKNLFKKLIEWVNERIQDVGVALYRIGFTKKKAVKLLNAIKSFPDKKGIVVQGYSGPFDTDNLVSTHTNMCNKISSASSGSIPSSEDITKEYEDFTDNKKNKANSFYANEYDVAESVKVIFDKGGLIRQINNVSKNTERTLKANLRAAKGFGISQTAEFDATKAKKDKNGIYIAGADAINKSWKRDSGNDNEISLIKDKIKACSNAASLAIKGFYRIVAQAIATVKAFLKNPTVKKLMKNEELSSSDKKEFRKVNAKKHEGLAKKYEYAERLF